MTISRIDPDSLPPAVGYSQATVAEGTRIVHVAGQVGITPDGTVVGPDHRSQLEQALRNLKLALEAAGATAGDVAKVTFYVVDYGPEVLGALFEATAAVFGSEPPTSAATLVGVAALVDPEYKVEVEATAILT